MVQPTTEVDPVLGLAAPDGTGHLQGTGRDTSADLMHPGERRIVFGAKASGLVRVLRLERREMHCRNVFGIVLTQGLNRQIRRMCATFDYQVRRLQRVRIINIRLDGIKVGQWRELTPAELQGLLPERTRW